MRVERGRISWPGGSLIRLNDGMIRFGRELFSDPRGRTLPEVIVLPVHAFLLMRQGEAPILIDTGEGGPDGGVALALAGLGVTQGEIGTVVFTHLHGDHRGGYLAGGYEHSRVCLSAAEAKHWAEQDHPARQVLTQAEGRIERLEDGDELAPGLRVWALPGHTPGHIGLVLDDRIAIVGDLVHRADLQLPDPELVTRFDTDTALAGRTRNAALREIAARRLVFCGGHIRVPGQEDDPAGGAFLRLSPHGSGWEAMAA